MWVLLLVLGTAVVGLVLVDVLTTTVNVTERPGRLARLIIRASSRPLERLLGRRERPTVALVQVVLLIVAWTGLLWLGWWLIVLGEPFEYVHGDTGAVADALDLLYVAGFGVFALGVGDIGPTTTPAQLVQPLSAVTGLALVTLEITYLLTLTQAVAHKRQVARMLQTLGEDVEDIVTRCWSGSSFAPASAGLTALVTELSLLAERQLTVPVLYEFGARRRELAVAPRLVMLFDAVHLMHDRAAPKVRLPRVTAHQVLVATDEFARATPVEGGEVAVRAEPPATVLVRLGVPLADQPHDSRPAGVRRRLHVMAEAEGWPVDG